MVVGSNPTGPTLLPISFAGLDINGEWSSMIDDRDEPRNSTGASSSSSLSIMDAILPRRGILAADDIAAGL